MRKLSTILRKAKKAVQDFDLVEALQSEITHELSSNHFQDFESGALGNFVVEWDSSQSQDVVLRRKCKTGEEVAVSALLGPVSLESAVSGLSAPVPSGRETGDGMFPRDVLMKICVKKPGLRSVLQFDCEIYKKGSNGSGFNINNAYYLQSSVGPVISSSVYRGPIFSDLEPRLQDAFKDYLVSKGIGESLTNFLLLHLHEKEHGQYVNWLKELKSFVTDVE
ncbi:Mitochondrial glycoprotein [Trema orientale]|uniref:Mitochondrial glycoprotein n=1 Tax=Trema orientale TaxID=63057 RepID=A0A2P5A7C6_TREOI|nr:Mitochondrial glycoprotein [Trema orientale]